jgi:ubiquinone/menaquinone biosynthesis C-methylase UbiE
MKDNFSAQADLYAKYRPRYPQELFDFVLRQVSNKKWAWDCATGNGQSAKVLAGNFEKVYATDISSKQIDHAEPASNIYYSVQPADKTDFDNDSFDLVTVSQALHWFANDEFYAEVKRVSKPLSVFAAWSYSLLNVSPDIDKLIVDYYRNVIGPYWDAERKYVDDEYKTIFFPFREIPSPRFEMNYYWTIGELAGYFKTWSAFQKFIAANNPDPIPGIMERIRPHWNDEMMKISFPLHMRIGYVDK